MDQGETAGIYLKPEKLYCGSQEEHRAHIHYPLDDKWYHCPGVKAGEFAEHSDELATASPTLPEGQMYCYVGGAHSSHEWYDPAMRKMHICPGQPNVSNMDSSDRQEKPFPVLLSDNGNWRRERIVAMATKQDDGHIQISIPQSSPLYKFLQSGILESISISASVKIHDDPNYQQLADQAMADLEKMCNEDPFDNTRFGYHGSAL